MNKKFKTDYTLCIAKSWYQGIYANKRRLFSFRILCVFLSSLDAWIHVCSYVMDRHQCAVRITHRRAAILAGIGTQQSNGIYEASVQQHTMPAHRVEAFSRHRTAHIEHSVLDFPHFMCAPSKRRYPTWIFLYADTVVLFSCCEHAFAHFPARNWKAQRANVPRQWTFIRLDKFSLQPDLKRFSQLKNILAHPLIYLWCLNHFCRIISNYSWF